MNAFSLSYLVVFIICASIHNCVWGLTHGLRCRDQANRRFVFHYASTNMAYTCSDCGLVVVQDYQGTCTHAGRPVYRYKHNAWQSCANGSTFSDVACVIDEECSRKSDLTGLGISTWTSQTSDGSCRRINDLGTEAYIRLISKFTTCHFDGLFSQSTPSILTYDFSNFVHLNSSPDACKYGPDKYVFYIDNLPRYCIVRTKDAFNGLCLPMSNMWKVLKTNFSTKAQRESTRSSNLEYKRYAIDQRMKIYNEHYGGYEGDFETTFKHIGRHLTSYFPERHNFRIDDTVVGANVFCEVALKSFPMETYQIYKAILPQECPGIKSRCVDRAATVLLDNRPYPKNLFKIWYDANKNASKCFLPQKVHGKTDDKNYCINFAAGAELIKQRNARRTNSHGYKNDYQASLVRTFRDPPNYQTPWHLRFEARSAEPLVTVLREMVDALGFHNEPQEMEFAFNGNSFKLGISAFCNLLLEMVPFSAKELTDAREEC